MQCPAVERYNFDSAGRRYERETPSPWSTSTRRASPPSPPTCTHNERSRSAPTCATARCAPPSTASRVTEHFGALDVVVANAGVTPAPATLRVMDPDDYDRVVAINQTGVFNTVHPAIGHIINTRGHIVIVASMAALRPGPTGSPYMSEFVSRRRTRGPSR